MATYQTYQEVGIKEDVSNVISNISPTKTPFQSALGKEAVTQTHPEWQEDSLRAAAQNAQIEGADPSDITVNPTTMRSNYTQIFTESVKISGTVEVTKAYGRARESAYQMAKSAAQVKRDLEFAMVGQTQAATAGNSGAARLMASADSQIDSGNVVTITAAALDESHLLTCLQDVYTAGADPSIIMCTPSNSTVIADFAKSSGRYRTFESGTKGEARLVNVVNLYVSPFGEQKVQLNRFLQAKFTYVYDPSMWSQLTLRPWTRETLAKTGDAIRMMLVGEFSLKHKNQKASGLIKDNQ